MKKINFKNLPDTTTPLSAENLNLLQNNIEESTVEVGVEQPTNKQAVWLKSSKNLIDIPNGTSTTIKGITFKVENGDFIIDGNGTGVEVSTERVEFKVFNFYLDAGTYRADFIRGNADQILYLKNYETKENIRVGLGTFTLTKRTRVYISFYTYNVIHSNKNVELIISSGTEQIPYEPIVKKEILTFNGSEYDKFSVIESGSNDNGSWVKFDDGTMICQLTKDFGAIDINSAWGVLYESKGLLFPNFPQKYKVAPMVIISPEVPIFIEKGYRPDTVNPGKFYAVRPQPVTSYSVVVSYFAIGFWK